MEKLDNLIICQCFGGIFVFLEESLAQGGGGKSKPGLEGIELKKRCVRERNLELRCESGFSDI